MLADEGTVIIKFYLHISKDEQRERLQARLDDAEKNWKFNTGDLDHRKLWADYMQAFEVALTKTSTKHVPWYIVPADKKWFRDIVMVRTIVETLRDLDMQYPPHPKMEPRVWSSSSSADQRSMTEMNMPSVPVM